MGGYFSGLVGAVTDPDSKNENLVDYAKDWKANRKKPSQSQTDADFSGAAAGEFKKGGMVKKTGLAKVHAGERVLTPAQNKRYEKSKRKKRA